MRLRVYHYGLTVKNKNFFLPEYSIFIEEFSGELGLILYLDPPLDPPPEIG